MKDDQKHLPIVIPFKNTDLFSLSQLLSCEKLGDLFTVAVGHSIGLECEEQHLFGPMQILDRPFEKNMVFEIEAWESWGKILIGVEDCYVVTDTGLRKITTLDKHIISK